MNIDYVVVQAGGKGTRMEHLTRNKPKALVPIGNLPMLFHLFHRYPEKQFVIIGDYKYDVLERYLRAFSRVKYQLVQAAPHTGTCSGLSSALEYIPEKEPFLLIWSDLVLPDEFRLPEESGDYIGIAKDFPCRWKYEGGKFSEERSEKFGVAGLFLFQDKGRLDDVPLDGEFVRWMSTKDIGCRELPIYNMKEYGLRSSYDAIGVRKCRSFNSISVQGNQLIKRAINRQGLELARDEIAWYRHVQSIGYKGIPTIFKFEPLTMECIQGRNYYEMEDLSRTEKESSLEKIVASIRTLHKLETRETDEESYMQTYYTKTIDRLKKVSGLVPFAGREYICINGWQCKNVFYHFHRMEQLVKQYIPTQFTLIHGDCTFSNMMQNQDGEPVFIDPRGYFGNTKLYGDPAYDWAKLYYSLVGNYDQFNLKRFDLTIGASEIELQIQSNGWEFLEDKFFALLNGEVTREQIQLFHGIIWLSLTTYAWEDYDSICGAFYNGLYHLRGIL